MKLIRPLLLSLGTTLAATILAIALAALLVPEQRTWLDGAKICLVLGALGWTAFFLPAILWEARRARPYASATYAHLGLGLGALIPLQFLVISGSYFLEWRGGQTLRLSLLAPCVGLLSGLSFSFLRPLLLPEDLPAKSAPSNPVRRTDVGLASTTDHQGRYVT